MPKETIEQHPVWATLKNFDGLRASEPIIETQADPKSAWIVQRVFEYAAACEARLVATPEVLRSAHIMNKVNNAVTQIYGELTNYINNRNPGHLDNADNHLDQHGLPILAQIPMQGSRSSAEELAQIVGDFNETTREMLRTLSVAREKVSQDFEQLTQQVAAQVSQLSDMTVVVAAQKAEAMGSAQAVRSQYETTEGKLVAQFQSVLTEKQAQFDEATRKQLALGEGVIKTLEELQAQAKSIVQIVGNIGVTGNYQNVAAAEAEQANRWRNVTVAFFVLAILVGGIAVFRADHVEMSTTIARMLFALVVASVTIYTGRESARHRTNADRAKRVELELASLGPFIDQLPEDKQTAIRSNLTSLYFGKEVEPHSAGKAIDPNSLVGLLGDAIKALAKR